MPFVESFYLCHELDSLVTEYQKTVKAVSGEEITKGKAIARLLDKESILKRIKTIKNERLQ